jgi:hypothetical protein
MNSSLLDSATVFQTMARNEFILCLTKRFSNVAVSFPMTEKEAKN